MLGKVDKELFRELQATGGNRSASQGAKTAMNSDFKAALQSAVAGDRKRPSTSFSTSTGKVSGYVSNDAAMDTFLSVDRIDDTNLFPESGNIFPSSEFNTDIATVNTDRNTSLRQMAAEGRLHGTYDRWDSNAIASYKPQKGRLFNQANFAYKPGQSADTLLTQQTDVNLDKYETYINESASNYGLDPALIKAVIVAESGGNAKARSRSGARGLMQLMPATARGLGVANSYDPKQNIDGGSRYLRQLLDKYDGNVHQALAAYNWGMGNLDRKPHKMPQQTKNYIAKVEGYYRGYTEDASNV
ncbi:lytic transglycosylase domain-containing protein [Candidatus Magnetominusculus xianensis]|uniref:Lytic transglycosylase n=1 Tax=Candidatus Magnetominusculus xianensis TaxID=1748249 RepID=A0ABR5SHB2_9BACT|nr:lytic transglycosylase domain-containing protein [Candidatus Magnetominusculus xianensis]KWT91076.1 lytic transglycosylase [Candidatus Magnetominusculus xianensis]MBF0403279.1 lytic transglycosylase domain-containing protein [Nitrospirota bacterium]